MIEYWGKNELTMDGYLGLSSIQYKHCCGDSWYRAGETNLPERMGQILSLSPEFTEVITWVRNNSL